MTARPESPVDGDRDERHETLPATLKGMELRESAGRLLVHEAGRLLSPMVDLTTSMGFQSFYAAAVDALLDAAKDASVVIIQRRDFSSLRRAADQC